jgi:adenine-specific DNA-methyltransferase
MLYPRDPSLDPQLVWKGKDEQDREPLEVDIVPIYIQEVIEPRVIIDAVQARKRTKPETSGFLPGFFDDFDALDFDRKIEFYQHDQKWANRMILGNSLHVMTSLVEKEGLKGKVQMSYIDPPYGIKFGSNWQVSTRKRDVRDGKIEDSTRQPEQVRAFRDTWKLGIHSYLETIRAWVVVARDLLTETGSILVQIGDANVHLVRCLMDEVLGSENFVSLINFRTTANIIGNCLGSNTDYLIWYARNLSSIKYRQLYQDRTYANDVGGRYTRIELKGGSRRFMTTEEREDISCLPTGARIYRHDNLASQGPTQSGTVWFDFEGNRFHPGVSSHWKTTVQGMKPLAEAHRLAAPTRNSLCYIRYLDDFPVAERTNVWTDTQTGAFTDDKIYVVQSNTKVIERCVQMTTDPGRHRSRSNVRLGHDGLCRRAVGPEVDHDRHQPGGAGTGPHATHGRTVSLLLSGRQLSADDADERR